MAHKPHLRLNGDTLEFLKKKKWTPVDPKKIMRISSLEDYINIHYVSKERLVVLMTITHAAEILLPFQFVRVSRQHIVRLDYIKEYSAQFIILNDSRKITIGRTYKKSVREIISTCPHITNITKPRTKRGFKFAEI